MKTPSLLLALLLALSGIGLAESPAAPERKPEPAAAKAVERTVRRAPVVVWNTTPNRPCESCACRPVRFAWSTAPGS